jgi:hypothetical protein
MKSYMPKIINLAFVLFLDCRQEYGARRILERYAAVEEKTQLGNRFRMYEGRLKSSWTHLITPSRNSMEMRWQSHFEVPLLASDALLTTLHPLLENVLQTVDHFEISCLGAPFSWLEKPRNRMGRDQDCMADVLMGFYRFTFSKPKTKLNSDLAPYDFPTMQRELWGKKFRSGQRFAARFREVGGAL